MPSSHHNVTYHHPINGSTASFSSSSSSNPSRVSPPTQQPSVHSNMNSEHAASSRQHIQGSYAPSPASHSSSMGSSQSVSTSPTAYANRFASKGVILGQAAASTGAKLKRALAGRRRPSEDISQFRNAHSDTGHRYVSPLTFHSAANEAKQTTPFGGKGRLALQLGSSVFGKKATKPSQAIGSPPPPPPKPSSNFPSASMPSLSLHQSLPDNRNSIMAVSPGMSSALAFMRQEDEQEVSSKLTTASPTPRPLPEPDRAESKEKWRRSDSTVTTVRQPGSRGSRPVSMAESSHSAHTIVPAAKRLSALVTDADYRMREEEEPSSVEEPRDPPHTMSNGQDTSGTFTPPHMSQPTPVPIAKIPAHPTAPLLSGHRPSPSDTPSLTRTTTNGIIGSSSLDSQPTSQNIRGTLRSLSPSPSAEDQSSGSLKSQVGMRGVFPAASHSNAIRQTAISITSSLTPAAGLAKRAVEKMGRAWGMHSSSNVSTSSSLSSTPPSSYSSIDYSLSRTSSNQSLNSKKPRRRTPDAPSSTWSIQSSSTSSDSDAFVPPPGPDLGSPLRGPLSDTRGGGRGLIFGRPLQDGVESTHVLPQHRSTPNDEQCSELVPIRDRRLSALALRCSQHILIWGIHEEGLFRVSGRPSHVSKLRAEFDSGADYSLANCSPGDLDPHAVSSIFKAYLRELPEPILTHRLQSSFEAAIATEMETSQTATPVASQPRRAERGFGLPSGPRGGAPLRKPPSLSTLAMPSFAGIPPASIALRNVLRQLIFSLPPENRDLLRTIVDLIRATSKASKETKMPLSNLLLVFYPSLNMSPPLLRVLCESSDIWETGPLSPVLDIRRDSQGATDIAQIPNAEASLDTQHPSNKPLPPAFPCLVPSDGSSVSPGSSVPSSPITPPAPDDVKVDLDTQLLPDSLYTTPSSSSNSLRPRPSHPTIQRMPSLSNLLKSRTRPSIGTPTSQTGKRPTISGPIPSPVQFPTTSGSVPATPVTSRRSMPLLSLPSLSSLRYKQVSPGLWSAGNSSRRRSLLRKHSNPDLHGTDTGAFLNTVQDNPRSYVLPSLSVDLTQSLDLGSVHVLPNEAETSAVVSTPSSLSKGTVDGSSSTPPASPDGGETAPSTARWPRGRTHGQLDLLPQPDRTMEDNWTESVLLDLSAFART